MNHPEEINKTSPNCIIKWVLKECQQRGNTKKDEGQSPNKGPKAMMTRSLFMHIHPPMKPKGQSPQDEIKILRG